MFTIGVIIMKASCFFNNAACIYTSHNLTILNLRHALPFAAEKFLLSVYDYCPHDAG